MNYEMIEKLNLNSDEAALLNDAEALLWDIFRKASIGGEYERMAIEAYSTTKALLNKYQRQL